MKIFLSYALPDKEWADELAGLLRSSGAEVSGGEGSSRFSDGLEEAYRQDLESAEFAVLLLTESSVRSPWVLFEIGAAVAARKTIVPVLVMQKGEAPHIPFKLNFHSSIKAHSPLEAAERLQQLVPRSVMKA